MNLVNNFNNVFLETDININLNRASYFLKANCLQNLLNKISKSVNLVYTLAL